MDLFPTDFGQLAFRWIHIVAGVLWIGLLYFFNWVNAAFAGTMDADTKRKVVPELMPRALFWFRWGAAFTWLSGVALAMLLYYSSNAPAYYYSSSSDNAGTTPDFGHWILPFGALLVLFVVYDFLAKSLSKQLVLLLAIWGAIAVAFGALLEARGLSARAVYIHIGALFGTSMAANVWMRIWPSQKRIITAVKGGTAPDPADPALAGLRSKHNTFMSIPLLLFMVSVHQDGMLAVSRPWLFSAIVIAIGFVGAWAIYSCVPKVKGF